MLIVCYRPHTLFDRYAVRALRCPIDKEKPEGFFGGRAGATAHHLRHARATAERKMSTAEEEKHFFAHKCHFSCKKFAHTKKKHYLCRDFNISCIFTNQNNN